MVSGEGGGEEMEEGGVEQEAMDKMKREQVKCGASERRV